MVTYLSKLSPNNLRSLRIALGIWMIAFGIFSVFIYSISGIEVFSKIPGIYSIPALAWTLSIIQISGGILLSIGYFQKILSLYFAVYISLVLLSVFFSLDWDEKARMLLTSGINGLVILLFLIVAENSTYKVKSN